MKLLLNLFINTLSVFLAAYFIPGVDVNSFFTAFLVAIVLGLLNTFVKPILIVFTLPVTIITLGLFTFVINVFLIFLTSYLIEGFTAASILSAVLFAVLLSLINSFLNSLSK